MKNTWWQIIDKAEKRGNFTVGEKDRAHEWPSCACGKADKRINRAADGVPNDNKLFTAGRLFAHCVEFNLFDKARECLTEIEKREGELLAKKGRG